MATKKSKSANKAQKGDVSKEKTVPKTKATSEVKEIKDTKELDEVEETTQVEEVEEDEIKDDSESKDTSHDEKKAESKAEAKKEEDEEKEVADSKAVAADIAAMTANMKRPVLRGFFERKYNEKESITTVFKKRRFYGALLGELIGTMFLTLLIFSMFLMGLPSIATYSIALIAIILGVYAFSGACLNPIVTAGMMATRRISVIRGVMYIIMEIVGAWLGWLIFNAFHGVGGESAYDVPSIAALADGAFWKMASIEIMGGLIIGFGYTRAIKYRRSALTFGAVVAGSVVLAFIVGYVVSAAFLGASNNFVMNPAIAMMLQIFPTSGADFGEIFGGIMQALSLYVLLPMCAGAVGFYISDFVGRLSNDD
ncbi:aquaporin [Candidatus Saccharibacteria bacterium]|nr:aquaporin [Candidatus Saccharibacteria bacterium]